MGKDFLEFSINFIKIITILISMIALVPLLVWAERRISALMQNRLGPNRCGPLGLMQILADLVKPLMKEDFYKKEKKKPLLYRPDFSCRPSGSGLWLPAFFGPLYGARF